MLQSPILRKDMVLSKSLLSDLTFRALVERVRANQGLRSTLEIDSGLEREYIETRPALGESTLESVRRAIFDSYLAEPSCMDQAVRRWLPELARLAHRYGIRPWRALSELMCAVNNLEDGVTWEDMPAAIYGDSPDE